MKRTLLFFLISVFIIIIVFPGCKQDTVANAGETKEISAKDLTSNFSNEEKEKSTESGPNPESTAESVITEKISVEIIPISPEEVKVIVESGQDDYFLIDVRTPEEFAEGYIKGANLIPVSEIISRLNEIPRDKQIIVYCRSGVRSRNAAEILINNGFEKVYDMGGIINWQGQGFEIIMPET